MAFVRSRGAYANVTLYHWSRPGKGLLMNTSSTNCGCTIHYGCMAGRSPAARTTLHSCLVQARLQKQVGARHDLNIHAEAERPEQRRIHARQVPKARCLLTWYSVLSTFWNCSEGRWDSCQLNTWEEPSRLLDVSYRVMIRSLFPWTSFCVQGQFDPASKSCRFPWNSK